MVRKSKKFFQNVRSSRKGIVYELQFLLIELILIGLTFVILLTFVTDVTQNKEFRREYYTRDFAQTLNIIYASPGDLSYTYWQEFLGDYNITLSRGIVTLLDGSTGKNSKYPFIQDSNYNEIDIVLENPEQIWIIKKARHITITDDPYEKDLALKEGGFPSTST